MSDVTLDANVNEARSRGVLGDMAAKFLRHRLGMAGLIVIVAMIVCAVFAPWLAPYDPFKLHYEAIGAPPSADHWLGTDEIGRDLLSRLIYGTRVSLQIVSFSTVLSLVGGSLIGLLSGYVGGRVDDLIMRGMDILLAFPLLVLALAIIAVLGPNLMNAIIALSIVGIPGFARLVRAQTLSVRERDYVVAARAIGASATRVVLLHVWPSVVGNVIVFASVRASSVLIAESSLAFLGLGAEPPTPTWGQMLAIAMEFWSAWWMSVFPGLAIFLAALAFNFFGDGLRDVLDARLDD